MTVDREALRVRLIDLLSLFAPRRGWEVDHRIPYWLDRLMEADRPDDGSEKAVAVLEVERLRRRVAELQAAYDLLREAGQDAEAEAAEAERALQARLQRDAHVVAVEVERDELLRRIGAVRVACSAFTQLDDPGYPYLLPEDATRFLVRVLEALDTPSTPLVDES